MHKWILCEFLKNIQPPKNLILAIMMVFISLSFRFSFVDVYRRRKSRFWAREMSEVINEGLHKSNSCPIKFIKPSDLLNFIC